MAHAATMRYLPRMTDFSATAAFFDLPEGVIYLDGNSLGPLPRHAAARVGAMVRDEWGQMLIRGWNQAGWMDLPQRIGARIAPLIGAAPGSVTVGDTLSIQLYQALSAALELARRADPTRKVVLTDSGNFPSDLYIAQGLLDSIGGYQLRVTTPEAIPDAITDQIAVLMLTQVDYRTGWLHDMAGLTARAHDAGALALWDLAHSAGALPVDLTGAKADFAVGCTYKFLNGGPGAPGFIHVAPRHAETARPALAGWLGHAAPFDFEPAYRPAPGIARMRIGTPGVLALTALDAALDVWDSVDMADLRAASINLADTMIAEVARTCPGLTLASPPEAAHRGSQLSFAHPQGYAVMQALIDRGVIGDFRAPNLIRFGLTPLYTSPKDIRDAVAILADILDTGAWDRPEYHRRNRVT